MAIESVNPATGERLKVFSAFDRNAVEERLQKATSSFRDYRRTPLNERKRLMQRLAACLEGEEERWAKLMTLEMGKPLQAARDEVKKCALTCRHFAEQAESYLQDIVIKTSAKQSYVCFQPLGPVLAIMPWNFPFWQVFRFAAPALMAGNVALLKHASNVPQSALAIEEIFLRAGFPAGVFQTLLIDAKQSQEVLQDARVVAVTLTGSEAAGSAIGSLAGKLIKKSVLELGGSDPFIVCASANLKMAAKKAAYARTINNGQSCIAAKRFVVVKEVADVFEELFIQELAALKVGDPMDPSVAIGPLATRDILEELTKQVEAAVQGGATLRQAGKVPAGKGYYYAPSLLKDIPQGAAINHEEVFGPVALVYRVKDCEAAITLANDSPYGLGASLWTEDASEKKLFIETLEAGACFVNAVVASDPLLPFGGLKRSGYGRELGEWGIREFVNVKTVVVN